jgi:hypothetical protein
LSGLLAAISLSCDRRFYPARVKSLSPEWNAAVVLTRVPRFFARAVAVFIGGGLCASFWCFSFCLSVSHSVCVTG